MARSRIDNLALRILFGERPPVHKRGNVYEVASETYNNRKYTINLGPRPTCDCPFWRKTRKACKHIKACQLDRVKATLSPGKPPSVPNPYKNPAGYDRAKQGEAVAVAELLRCLGARIAAAPPIGAGRPPIPLGDLAVCITLARYHNKPSRRAIIDPGWYRHRGFVRGAVPAPATLRKYMQNVLLEAELVAAIRLIADCVHHLEHTGMVDATYVRQPVNEHRVAVNRNGRTVVKTKIRGSKLHFVAGSKTHVIYAVHVTSENANDSPALGALLKELSAQNKRFKHLTADEGYNSAANYEAIWKAGMVPFIDFAWNAKPSGTVPIFDKQYAEWKKDSAYWNEGYSVRKLIEAVNHAFKMTLTRRLRSKKEASSRNEVLSLVLAFNLTRLVMAYVEYGIAIPWADVRAMSALEALKSVKAA